MEPSIKILMRKIRLADIKVGDWVYLPGVPGVEDRTFEVLCSEPCKKEPIKHTIALKEHSMMHRSPDEEWTLSSRPGERFTT